MRTLVCDRPGEITVSERPRPSPGPGQVLVRIRRAGVCGTDLHIFEGSHPFLEYPRVIGHELSGEIAETGPACAHRGRRAGLRHPLSRLWRLRRLPARQDQLLPAIGVLGVHIDGGMADYVCVPEANLAPADGVTLDQAAMVEFLAIGAHAVAPRANPGKGDRILVVGAGPIGIGCMMFGKLRAASDCARPAPGPARFLPRPARRRPRGPGGGGRRRSPVGAHGRRLLRHRHRRDRQREVDDGRTRLCRPWRSLCPGQRRARHDLLSPIPSSTSARPRCSAAATRRRRISRSVRRHARGPRADRGARHAPRFARPKRPQLSGLDQARNAA